jgi:lipopolysaccharide transport system ATP-binding protein
LAVGDAEFQKKCLGKMGDISKGEGRTVLFVSHNMAAVQSLCSKGILLENGAVNIYENIQNVIEYYSNNSSFKSGIFPNVNKEVYLKNILIYNDNKSSVQTGGKAIFEIVIESKIEGEDFVVGLGINDGLGNRVVTPFSMHLDKKYNIKKGENIIFCEIPFLPIKPNIYTIQVYIGTKYKVYDYYDKNFQFIIETSLKEYNHIIPDSSQGNIIIEQIWN